MGLAQARDGTHRLVALKRLNLETVQDAHIVTMFEDEARVTSRIKHPNIVRTHGFHRWRKQSTRNGVYSRLRWTNGFGMRKKTR